MAHLNRKNFLGQGNDSFQCLYCHLEVLPLLTGFRNHCPRCLYSLHVDEIPGDRDHSCGGLMEPTALDGSEGAGWFIVHRCKNCGIEKRNSVATDDPRQPDSWDQIVAISIRA